MKNAPTDEPIHEHDEDMEANPKATLPAGAAQNPAIIAVVGSGAVGSVDVEPQKERHPDNDGETVEG